MYRDTIVWARSRFYVRINVYVRAFVLILSVCMYLRVCVPVCVCVFSLPSIVLVNVYTDTSLSAIGRLCMYLRIFTCVRPRFVCVCVCVSACVSLFVSVYFLLSAGVCVPLWRCLHLRRLGGIVCLLVGCLTSQQHAKYLRDGSAQTILRVTTLR